MVVSRITSIQVIQTILAPAVMISSSALFFLGLSSRYVALLQTKRKNPKLTSKICVNLYEQRKLSGATISRTPRNPQENNPFIFRVLA